MVTDPLSTTTGALSPAGPPPSGDKPFSIFGFQPFGDDGPTFYDMLDIVNPLQHVPLVSYLYRELTGDEIDPVPRLAGGALFGGVIGAAGSLVNVVFEEVVGDDIGGAAIAMVKDLTGFGDDTDAESVLVADNRGDSPSRAGSAVAEHADVLDWARGEVEWQVAALAAQMETAGGSPHAGAATGSSSFEGKYRRDLSLLSPKVAGDHLGLDIHA